VAAGVDGVDGGGADLGPDPQAAASAHVAAARAIPARTPGRSRLPPDEDTQLGCISRSLAHGAQEVNRDTREGLITAVSNRAKTVRMAIRCFSKFDGRITP
jgi:hypothetical protein